MKKVSLLMALALIVTIGGVYAAWTYTETAQVTTATHAMSPTIDAPTTAGDYGTYTFSGNPTIKVEPKAGTTHITSLEINGDLTVTFTPNTFAPEEVKQGGVNSTYKFEIVDNQNYGDPSQPILYIANEELHNINWEKEDDGTFTCVIPDEVIAECVKATEFNLDTVEKHSDYAALLEHIVVRVIVEDAI